MAMQGVVGSTTRLAFPIYSWDHLCICVGGVCVASVECICMECVRMCVECVCVVCVCVCVCEECSENNAALLQAPIKCVRSVGLAYLWNPLMKKKKKKKKKKKAEEWVRSEWVGEGMKAGWKRASRNSWVSKGESCWGGEIGQCGRLDMPQRVITCTVRCS